MPEPLLAHGGAILCKPCRKKTRRALLDGDSPEDIIGKLCRACRKLALKRDREMAMMGNADDWPAADHAAYQPPWRNRRASGELGPWYGPKTAGAMARKMKGWRESVHSIGRGGSGLWDPREVAAMKGKMTVEERRRVVRGDDAVVRAYVMRKDSTIDPFPYEVFTLFFDDLKTEGEIAAETKRKKETVRTVLKQLRREARAYDEGRKARTPRRAARNSPHPEPA